MEIKADLDNKSIGRRIRQERERLGLSREEFAEIIDLSNYYIGQLERGERQMSLPVLVKVAACLHVSLDYLVFGSSAAVYRLREEGDCYEVQNLKNHRIIALLNKCSPKELELIEKLIKTILPYTSK